MAPLGVDNFSSIDEAFADCALPTPPGPPPLWRPRSIPNNWADVSGFLKAPFLDKLLVYAPMSKAAIMRHGFIYISWIGTTNGSHQATTTGTFTSRNVQRVLEIELQNLTSAKY